MKCHTCNNEKAALKRPKTAQLSCIKCFINSFEEEIHETIIENSLFTPNEIVCIGVSGGKDSTVLAHIIHTLNLRYSYNINIQLVAIDEGIKGYRDDSLITVKKNAEALQLPLTILSYKELFNWTMDEIVDLIGLNNCCTYCGVFRRQALEKGATVVNATKLVTGHNADDIAETVLMNLLRGDYHRLPKSVEAISGKESVIPRVKPFKYTYEKEIVMYAHYMKLLYFCTECTYSVTAYRGKVRELIKELEMERSTCIVDIIHSGENWAIDKSVKKRNKIKCGNCGLISSNELCKACILLGKLEEAKKKKGNNKDKTKDKIKIEYDNMNNDN